VLREYLGGAENIDIDIGKLPEIDGNHDFDFDHDTECLLPEDTSALHKMEFPMDRSRRVIYILHSETCSGGSSGLKRAEQGATPHTRENPPMTMHIAAPIITVFLLLATIGHLEAFDQADLDQLRASKQCPKCDLAGANLSGAKLNRADLSETNLRNADLSWANLNGAGLVGTDLSNADLSNANLSWSDLRGANLTEATLTRANLTGAKLGGATWTDGRKCPESSMGGCG
jgi:hypothetical protein